MLSIIARKQMTLSTDKGIFLLVKRQRLNILSSKSICMFGANYLQLVFKSGNSQRTFNVLASEFTTLFS